VDRDREGGSTLMAPDDGEWIRDEMASPAGARGHGSQPAGARGHGSQPTGDAGRPGHEWPGQEWLDEDWPDDESPDDEPPDDDSPDDEPPVDDWPPGPPGPPPETGKRWGHGGVPGFSVWAAAAVAVLAAAAGVAVGLLLVRGTPTASAAGSATPGASAPGATAPGTTAPGGGGTNLLAPPGPGGNGNGQLRIILTGRVLAISATSITIGGNGPSVTAAVTSATKITGTARGIAGVKPGDQVAAQVSGTPGHLIAIAIQDPAGSSS
jgi:hypothetical protein